MIARQHVKNVLTSSYLKIFQKLNVIKADIVRVAGL